MFLPVQFIKHFSHFIYLFLILFVCVCTYEWGFPQRPEEGVEPPGVGGAGSWSHLMWMLGTEL